MWWEDEDFDGFIPDVKGERDVENEPTWKQTVCIHSWTPIRLIISTVYDCSKCGIKKEKYEEWQKKRNPF